MPIITFPMLILGIDILINEDKKMPIVLCISAFLQATCGFYFLYMEVIFGIIYYFISVFFTKVKERKIISFLKKAIKGILFYLIGLCMAGLFLLPSVMSFFNSTRVGMDNKISIFYDTSKYLQNIYNLIIPRAFEDVLGITILSLISIVIVFLNKSYLKYKLILGIIIIGFALPLFGSLMNGLSYSTDRWTFIMQFFFSFTVVMVLDDNMLFSDNKKEYYLMIIPVCLCILQITNQEKGSILRGILYLLLSLFFIYLLRNIVKGRFNCERCFIFIVLLNLFLNIFMIYGPVKLGGSGLRAGFKTFEIIDKELADNPAVHINDSDSFYRVDVMSSTRGESMILDYYGTAEYFSMINKNIYDFYDEMMISPGKGIFSWVLKNLDGRMILNSLLSAKYIEGFQEDSIYNRVAYRNINSLPLGYVYSDYIEKDFFMTLNPLERQEIMLHSVVLEQKIETMGQKSREQNCSELQPFFYRPITYNIDYINIEKNAEEIQVNSTSEILINTADVEEGENYIFLEGFKRNFNTSDAVKLIIGNKEVELTGKGIDDLMINIGTSNIASLRFSREGTYSIDKICMYHLSEKDIKRPIEKLRQNSLQNIKISGNTVSGEINSKIDGLLFLSIPYGTGWEAYVDGVKTNIYKANIGFMAIPLKQGEHVIVLHYTTPGIWVGGILALVGWFLWEL